MRAPEVNVRARVNAADEDGGPHTGQYSNNRGERYHEQRDGPTSQARRREARHVQRRGRYQPVRHQPGNHDRPNEARDRQEHSFQHGATDETPSRRAERHLDRERVVSDCRPEDLQTSDTATGQKDHEQRSPEHRPQHRPRRALQVGSTGVTTTPETPPAQLPCPGRREIALSSSATWGTVASWRNRPTA